MTKKKKYEKKRTKFCQRRDHRTTCGRAAQMLSRLENKMPTTEGRQKARLAFTRTFGEVLRRKGGAQSAQPLLGSPRRSRGAFAPFFSRAAAGMRRVLGTSRGGGGVVACIPALIIILCAGGARLLREQRVVSAGTRTGPPLFGGTLAHGPPPPPPRGTAFDRRSHVAAECSRAPLGGGATSGLSWPGLLPVQPEIGKPEFGVLEKLGRRVDEV